MESPTDTLIRRLPRRLKMSELRVFVAVLEHRSFRKAAAVLHLTQPAVTKAIAGLEEMLEVALFDRASDGVVPTAHGLSFAPRAVAVFEELRRAAQELALVSGPMERPVAMFVDRSDEQLTRAAIEETKELQRAWKGVGLVTRHQDNALWEEFRKHCDAVFERSSQESVAYGATLEANRARAIGLCEDVERIATLEGDDLQTGLRQLPALY